MVVDVVGLILAIAMGLLVGSVVSRALRALVGRLVPRGGAMLIRVRSDAGTVGCVYNLIEGRRALSYLQGFAPAPAPNAARPSTGAAKAPPPVASDT